MLYFIFYYLTPLELTLILLSTQCSAPVLVYSLSCFEAGLIFVLEPPRTNISYGTRGDGRGCVLRLFYQFVRKLFIYGLRKSIKQKRDDLLGIRERGRF